MKYEAKELDDPIVLHTTRRIAYTRLSCTAEHWTLHADSDTEGLVYRMPLSMADTIEQAEKVLAHMLKTMNHVYHVGEKNGRAQAQRFYRLALGVEQPTDEEAALWDNPVPLAHPVRKDVR